MLQETRSLKCSCSAEDGLKGSPTVRVLEDIIEPVTAETIAHIRVEGEKTRIEARHVAEKNRIVAEMTRIEARHVAEKARQVAEMTRIEARHVAEMTRHVAEMTRIEARHVACQLAGFLFIAMLCNTALVQYLR